MNSEVKGWFAQRAVCNQPKIMLLDRSPFCRNVGLQAHRIERKAHCVVYNVFFCSTSMNCFQTILVDTAFGVQLRNRACSARLCSTCNFDLDCTLE